MSSPARRPTAGARYPIWLVRHAPTEWTGRRWCGRSDPELSAVGREAADRLAGELATDVAVGHAVGVIVLSSPLRRAFDTAGFLARALDAQIRVEPDLAEIDFGAADGLTWDELATAHPSLADEILAGGQPDWPAGESADQVAARARSAAARILDLAQTTELVVVTHGGLLAVLARHLGGEIPSGPIEAASAHRLNPVPLA